MNKNFLFLLSLGGLLFSGYLGGQKFFNNICALNECPYFLGYPACYYGFAMYLTLFISALLFVFFKKGTLRVIQIVSFMGILFSGYFTVLKLPKLLNQGLSAYVLGLPSCAYGLIFYVLIFTLSLRITQDK